MADYKENPKNVEKKDAINAFFKNILSIYDHHIYGSKPNVAELDPSDFIKKMTLPTYVNPVFIGELNNVSTQGNVAAQNLVQSKQLFEKSQEEFERSIEAYVKSHEKDDPLKIKELIGEYQGCGGSEEKKCAVVEKFNQAIGGRE